MQPKEWAEKIVNGDIRAASRLMRDIDDRMPWVSDVLKELYPHTGRAYIIGVTGSPGVGKSTLVDRLIEVFRKQGDSIGVVVIDPTSPFTGGAILGDRIRMQRHSTDSGVFIRSLATRGSMGGLSRSTSDILRVMDAMGKDVILLETVGVGQDEVDVVNTAHTSMIVMIPGLGDDIQAIKAGILEIGDIFVINKCEREGAERMEREIMMMLELGAKRKDGWVPKIVKTEAIKGMGIKDLLEAIEAHRAFREDPEHKRNFLRKALRIELLNHVKDQISSRVLETIGHEEGLTRAVDEIIDGKKDLYTKSEEILEQLLCR
ncbi:MAG: methylmalonyl Co-A mutase-associated GTPase MeaB [Deltaproteobacteria bacterium]|nr:MAG: methylmalonyl Co-A mutase-associated GTPase MeaB [Deltaproteobacteria bacterium]